MELIQNAKNKQQVNQVFKLIAPLPIIWPSETDCTRALANFSQYHLSEGVGLLDALIGECAVGKRLLFALLMLNIIEFPKNWRQFKQELISFNFCY